MARWIIADEKKTKNPEIVGMLKGHFIWEFSFKDDESNERYWGVIATYIADEYSHAIRKNEDGFWEADYDALGIPFQKLDEKGYVREVK